MTLTEFINWCMETNLSGDEEFTFLNESQGPGRNVSLNYPMVIDSNNSSLKKPIIRFQLGGWDDR